MNISNITDCKLALESKIFELIEESYEKDDFLDIDARHLHRIYGITRENPNKYSFKLERHPTILGAIPRKGCPLSAFNRVVYKYQIDLTKKEIDLLSSDIIESVINYDSLVDDHLDGLDFLEFDFEGITSEKELISYAKNLFLDIDWTTLIESDVEEIPTFDENLFLKKLCCEFCKWVLKEWEFESRT